MRACRYNAGVFARSGVSLERYHVRQNDSGISGIMLIDRVATMAYRRRLIRRAAICTSVTTKIQFAALCVTRDTYRIDNSLASLGIS